MIKLRKYTYKFWLAIVLCIGFVFIQSQSELALPDYMSTIVTNGIQAGGFDTSIAEVMSEDTYQHLLIFTHDKQKKVIESCYTFKKYNQLDKDIKIKFPQMKDGYVLKELSLEEQKELETALIKPMLMVSAIDSMDPHSLEYKEKFGHIPEGIDIYQAISMMDQNTKDQMTQQIDSQIEAMGESTMLIAAGNGVKNEYIKLGADVDAVQNDYIFLAGLKMLGIALLGSVAAMASAFLSSRVGSGVARDLRRDVFKKVESFSNTEFNKFSTASLITRTTNDITQVQMLMIMLLRIVLFAPMMGIGSLYKALTHSTSMTWIILMILIVITVILLVLIKVVMPKFKIIQSLIDRLNLTMRENLSGILVIRAFGNEKHSEERFDKANDDLTKVNLFVNRAMATLMPIMMFIMNIATVLVVWVGAQQLDLGNIAIGEMLAFIQYAMHIIMSFLFVAMIFIMIPRASVAAERVYEVLSTKVEIQDPIKPLDFDKNKKGLIEFKDVSFQYPGAQEAVLSHIDFIAEPGKTTAFIGSTGSGKSTLVNLIPRFYDVSEGEIFVDGVNIQQVKQHDLRELIGIVPQKGILFSGTIRSNLQYGAHHASDMELSEVIRIAQAKEFVDDKPQGLDEEISQGGTNVSGGQKQRLAIARALAKNPEILIFDDSFSALDFKTDAILRKELNQLTKKTKSTVLIVGQRIASIMDADQIIVLDNGKIVGKGTHDELLKSCQVYQEIAYSQLSKEELANA
ncbi:MAG: ABC transporter ATP-binding protein [Coprobacillus sp.]|nr:ABC transporter ATP-binding protein [Coprobacillus sp.]